MYSVGVLLSAIEFEGELSTDDCAPSAELELLASRSSALPETFAFLANALNIDQDGVNLDHSQQQVLISKKWTLTRPKAQPLVFEMIQDPVLDFLSAFDYERRTYPNDQSVFSPPSRHCLLCPTCTSEDTKNNSDIKNATQFPATTSMRPRSTGNLSHGVRVASASLMWHGYSICEG